MMNSRLFCFALALLLLFASSSKGDYDFKGITTLKGSGYFELFEGDAPFYLSYTLNTLQDVNNLRKTFSVVLVDTPNYNLLTNGSYDKVAYFSEASAEVVSSASITYYYVVYGSTGPRYYLLLINQDLLSPVTVQYEVIATPSRISTELEVAVAVIAMLCFCCCCFASFYCMRSQRLKKLRGKLIFSSMNRFNVRRNKRPIVQDEMEDDGGGVALEETDRS